MATTLTKDQLRQVAQARADGTAWSKIGNVIGLKEKAAKAAFDRACIEFNLGADHRVAQAIPAERMAAIAESAILAETPEAEPILSDEDRAMQQDTEDTGGRTVALVSGEYAKVVAELLQDPIIRSMAGGLASTPRKDMVDGDGGPRHEFMMGANLEYHDNRGGKIYGHIGAVAEALLVFLSGKDAVAKAIADAGTQAPAEDDEPVDLAEQVANEQRAARHQAAAAEPQDVEPAAKTERVTECERCGFHFTRPQARRVCQSEKACERRQAAKAE
jgi:hypothetical protein